MPQLDFVTFFNQVFWFIFFFSVFYSLSLKAFLPFLGRILKIRTKKLLLNIILYSEDAMLVLNNQIHFFQSSFQNQIKTILQLKNDIGFLLIQQLQGKPIFSKVSNKFKTSMIVLKVNQVVTSKVKVV